ncbi:MAG: NADH-quinone oxidoreductase subunit NuoE [Hyphomicrobiaceae bacterium]|nr:NADH-quinone oxidoreductase subunit NuoE [Hyphomicrobiaceae bacterium]
MAVRRLAPKEVQPASFAFTAENEAWAAATIAKYPAGREASAVIPFLMRAQDQEGWVSEPAIRFIAEKLGMNTIRVLEVATFYTQFQLAPIGTVAHVQVCGTTPCMLRGAEDIKHVCQNRIHHDPFHLSADGKFSWEEVECLGSCVNAPMVLIDRDTYEDLTPESFGQLLDAFERGETPKAGTQIDRPHGGPAGGETTLTEMLAGAGRPAGADDMIAANMAAQGVARGVDPSVLASASAQADVSHKPGAYTTLDGAWYTEGGKHPSGSVDPAPASVRRTG